ncbi:MAG: molybdenum cofactor biosynthesis protein MoaE [Cytophagales bacterium]|nr:MAG: molybdenum cofactor biosynthesis protein MoaE [Cytophagales bacterium]
MEHLTYKKINITKLLEDSHHESCGAVVLFIGDVRNHNIGKSVQYLEYEAFTPMAESMIQSILQEAKGKWQLQTALCLHRIGKVEVLESAVCVITSSVHRNEAYQANQYIMERVKHEAPIWKKEVFLDGTYEWGNNCGCHPDGFKSELHAKNVPLSFSNIK